MSVVRPTPSVERAPSPKLLVIMFTDIVSSTAIKLQIGVDEYRSLKARHDEFIRWALAGAAGAQVLQDTGDGYFVSFPSVAQAVASALLFQWRMAKESWPLPFKSRVGLHLGEVQEGQSVVTQRADFISAAIDAASRTMSLAVGGQILMTRAVYDAAKQVARLPPRIDEQETGKLVWKSHGKYRFKGVEEPVEIFEVGLDSLSPLVRPPDSDKAWRTGMNRATTRRMAIKGAAVAIPLLVAGLAFWLWPKRVQPMEAMRRQEIEREIARVQAVPPATNPAVPVGAKRVDRITVGKNSEFDVLNDHRILDMRGWKEVPTEKLGQHYSQVTMTRQLHLIKKSPANIFEVQSMTSGLDVTISCEEGFPTTYEIQRGESIIGAERMKVRKMNIDVSSVPVGQEFILHVGNTYWNSLQTESEQWVGLIGYPNSSVASVLAIFPPGKPFKKYRLMTSKTEKEMPVEFSGPRAVIEDGGRQWVYWEIQKPDDGRVYRLHWDW